MKPSIKTSSELTLEKTAPKPEAKLNPFSAAARTAEFNAGCTFPIPSAEATATRNAGIIANAPDESVPIKLREARDRQSELDSQQVALDAEKSAALGILYDYQAKHRRRVEQDKHLARLREQILFLEKYVGQAPAELAERCFGPSAETFASHHQLLGFYTHLPAAKIALGAGRDYEAKLKKEIEELSGGIAALKTKHDLPDARTMKPVDELAATGIEPCADAGV